MLAIWVLAACSVRPAGEKDERERLARAGAAYRQALHARDLPVLRADSPLTDHLAHAELAHGELEAAWHRWAAALERVPQAGTQPTTAMLGVEHRLDGGDALDRTALVLMSDAMNNLLLPGRLEARAEAALAAARVRAAEFGRERLRLQVRVAEAYYALAERDEDLRLLERLRALLATVVPSVTARVGADAASQSELLRARVALDRADAELAALRASRPALVARLGALAGTRLREAEPSLPPIAPLVPGEAEQIEAALAANPQLEIRRREAEATLAVLRATEWERVPEFSLRSMLSGDGAVTLGGALTLPFLRGGAIAAAIREAGAEADAARALRRQAVHDEVAAVLAERAELQAIAAEADVLTTRLLPNLAQAADVARARWTAAGGEFVPWIEALTLEVETERMLARLRARHAVGRARLQEALGEAMR